MKFKLSDLDLLSNSVSTQTFEQALIKLLGEITACSVVTNHVEKSDIATNQIPALQIILYHHHHLISAFKKSRFLKSQFHFNDIFLDQIKMIAITKAGDSTFVLEILCLHGAQVLNVFSDILSFIKELFPNEGTGPIGPAVS